jgi:hypothetical protein
MDLSRHRAATGIGGLRQLLVQIFCDDFLRLRGVNAALRVFFFTMAFFLVVLCEWRFSRATLGSAFGFFRSPDFPATRSTDPCSHSAPLRTVPLLPPDLRLLCHSADPSSPAISLRLRSVSTE